MDCPRAKISVFNRCFVVVVVVVVVKRPSLISRILVWGIRTIVDCDLSRYVTVVLFFVFNAEAKGRVRHQQKRKASVRCSRCYMTGIKVQKETTVGWKRR